MMERGPLWLQRAWDAVSPAMLALARSLAAIWEFLISPVGTMVAFGMIALVLTVDMDRVARMTRGLWFRARHAVSEQVWIGEDAALSLMKDSQWGRLSAPFTEENLFNSLSMAVRKTTGLSPVDKDRIKFYIFLKATLKEFSAANPSAFRVIPDSFDPQYDEVALRAFLDAALEEVILKDFGKPPSFKVT